ncbi:MAG: hypothetical protein ABR586_10225, partial [Thermoplasmatota archaeon]
MAVPLERTLLLLSGAAQLCVAGAILSVAPGRARHRAFAALLGLRGVAVLLPQASSNPAWAVAALNAQPYFLLASFPLAIYCLLAPYPGPAPRRAGAWTVAAAAALALAYGLDHALFHTLAPGAPVNPALRATATLQYVRFGPLAVLGAASAPLLACVGLRHAQLYREDPAHPRAALLVAGGFTLTALFDSASRLAALTNLLDAPHGYPWWPWGWAVPVLPTLALLPAILALGTLLA